MMANGGVIGPVGVNMAALAAKKHAVPFVVLAGCHKVGFCAVFFLKPLIALKNLKASLKFFFFFCLKCDITVMSTLSSQSGGLTKRAEISF